MFRTKNLKYFVKEGFYSFWRNWTMSLASVVIVTACLLTFGVYLAFSTNLNNILFSSQNSVENVFYISLETPLSKVRDIKAQIEAINNVRSATHISKEEGLAKYSEDRRRGITINDIPDSYAVEFKSADLASQTTAEILKISEIYNASLTPDTIKTIVNISNKVHLFSIILMIIMITVSIFIISNTIRITVFARRNDINIMMYVGATRWFVRWPFIIEGIIIGLTGAVISFGIMLYFYTATTTAIAATLVNLNDLKTILTPLADFMPILVGSFLTFGVLIGGFGSFISVRKHLHV